jgi:hypothetical protein
MRYLCVVIVILAVLLVVGVVYDRNPDRNMNRDMAQSQAKKIQSAIRLYHDRRGKFPDSLDQLLTPMGGGDPPEGGESLITDPWGKRFRFEVEADDKGNERVVVWTTDHHGERIQWPRE